MDFLQTRAFAGAFLRWHDEVLLMQRSIHKIISPGLWAGIGGHIEQSESDSPITACLREIEEETGILPEQIEEIDLRYFALCKTDKTLDSIYYFVGELKEKVPFRDTAEGMLYWIGLNDGLSLQMANHVKVIYTHWINNLNKNSLFCFVDSDFHLLNQGKTQ